MNLSKVVIEMLASSTPFPPKYCDHKSVDNYKGCRECHITPDWLFIY